MQGKKRADLGPLAAKLSDVGFVGSPHGDPDTYPSYDVCYGEAPTIAADSLRWPFTSPCAELNTFQASDFIGLGRAISHELEEDLEETSPT